MAMASISAAEYLRLNSPVRTNHKPITNRPVPVVFTIFASSIGWCHELGKNGKFVVGIGGNEDFLKSSKHAWLWRRFSTQERRIFGPYASLGFTCEKHVGVIRSIGV